MDAPAQVDLLFRDEVYRIQGAVFEVNRAMGRGFLEGVYQECLALEFAKRKIPFREKPHLRLSYKGIELKQTYFPDFVCFEKIIVELKASREIVNEHRAQVLNYLKATGFEVGLLVNFGAAPRAAVERLVLQRDGTANARESTRTVPGVGRAPR